MNNYPTVEFLYQNNAFIVKTNKKASLDYGDQEYPAQNLCYQHLKFYRNAIDIGARYGGWSRLMTLKFKHVYAFEPRLKWQIVYKLNIKPENSTLYPFGLGCEDEFVQMRGNRITNKIDDQPYLSENQVEIKTLDSFRLKKIDFIKIDTDGYELNVLKGGVKTITGWRPTICMEMIPGETYKGEIAEEYLLNLGYTKIDSIGQNSIYQWK